MDGRQRVAGRSGFEKIKSLPSGLLLETSLAYVLFYTLRQRSFFLLIIRIFFFMNNFESV